MSDKNVEKIFLYFVALSLLLHAVVGTLLYLLPEERRELKPEAYIVDLTEIPEPQGLPEIKKVPVMKTPELNERQKVTSLPKKEALMPAPETNLRKRKEKMPLQKVPQQEQQERTPRIETPESKETIGPVVRGDITKPKHNKLPDLAQLMPTERTLKALDDNFKQKYGDRVGGDTLFFDESNDLLGSFSRRFLEAIDQRWKQVASPLLRRGQSGYGLIYISINRDGSVTEAKVIESSGNKLIDEAAVHTAKTAGYVGALPKKWPYEKVNGYYVYTAGYQMR